MLPHRSPEPEFEALLVQHGGIVRRIAASYARTAADRADLAQEIALALWRAAPRRDPQRPVATWMYRVALNVAISQARRSNVRARVEPFATAPDELADPRSERADASGEALLERVLAALAPLERALLVLHLEDCSQREIAEVLGLSESNVSTRLHRLRARLRARFPDAAKP